MKEYDYIISGSGAAGLSLLMHMMQHHEFRDKKILVVDKSPKNTNDRTWCFWEKDPGLFEPIVHHQWRKMHFFSAYYSSVLDLEPYAYKMIRAIDFYHYVSTAAAAFNNITFAYGNIEALTNEVNSAGIILDGKVIYATFVFNSIMFSRPVIKPGKYYLLQHFKGWMIETPGDAFKQEEATLMDFRISQQKGTTFVYVLPLSANKALVEYTMFTKEILTDEAYQLALEHYIEHYLHIKEYNVVEQEFGIIPMTNNQFQKRIGSIVNIGTAGGQTKASSGYTFQFIQKQCRQIVHSLLNQGHPYFSENKFDRRFNFYDSTLLNILHHNKMGGDKIFADLFKKNITDRVLRFLDNESTLEDELNIMASMPKGIFMKAAFEEMFR